MRWSWSNVQSYRLIQFSADLTCKSGLIAKRFWRMNEIKATRMPNNIIWFPSDLRAIHIRNEMFNSILSSIILLSKKLRGVCIRSVRERFSHRTHFGYIFRIYWFIKDERSMYASVNVFRSALICSSHWFSVAWRHIDFIRIQSTSNICNCSPYTMTYRVNSIHIYRHFSTVLAFFLLASVPIERIVMISKR